MVYPILELWLPRLTKLWLGKVKGIENVPMGSSFIIAPNHSSYYDALLVPVVVIPHIGKKIHPFVNSNYWKNPLARYFLNHGECIPVYVKKEKNTRIKNNIAFQKAIDYINKKEPIMIFPEGSRSYDGKLKKAYTGIARLAIKTKVPILPFGIIGSNKVLPKGKLFPRFRRCKVNIGKPVKLEKYYKKPLSKKTLENATRDIMKELAKLIGQEYNY